MRHASLFSGIGGFDLAAQWMGWENVFQCEIDPFCQKILRHHFPSSILYDDIFTLNGTEWGGGGIDILTGGFPCQPFSSIGKRMGREDERHLWPEMLRVIQTVQPTWIVAENVRGFITIENGMAFEKVCSDLEANGYNVQPFCIPACAINASHRRERLWFIAYNEGFRWKKRHVQQRKFDKSTEEALDEISNVRFFNRGNNIFEFRGKDKSFFCGKDDGLPDRMDRLKSIGNAIVPQVAYQIFQSIPV